MAPVEPGSEPDCPSSFPKLRLIVCAPDGTVRETTARVMQERALEEAIATRLAGQPTACDVRDVLVDYLGLVGGRFVMKGFAHTDPNVDQATIRRVLVSRLALLWKGSKSTWASPALRDLALLRLRIEQWSCSRRDERYARIRSLLDELFIAAAVAERLKAARGRRPVPRLELLDGGREVSPPRGRLRIVRPPAVAMDQASSERA